MDIAEIKKEVALLYQYIDGAQKYLVAVKAQVDKLVALATNQIPTDPSTPVDPSPTTKELPGTVLWEDSSDAGEVEYRGKAVMIFPKEYEGKITKVVAAGETAFHAASWKGQPTFRLSKPGSEYKRPITLAITTTAGNFTKVINEGSSQPTGNNQETVAPSSYGNGNRGNARFSKPGNAYGKNIPVFIDGVLKLTVSDGSKRTEGRNGLIWKPVSDSNGRLVVVGEYNVKFKTCTIKW